MLPVYFKDAFKNDLIPAPHTHTLSLEFSISLKFTYNMQELFLCLNFPSVGTLANKAFAAAYTRAPQGALSTAHIIFLFFFKKEGY